MFSTILKLIFNFFGKSKNERAHNIHVNGDNNIINIASLESEEENIDRD